MDPAHTIIELLGGDAVVCRVTGVAASAPYRWRAPKGQGGTGGTIPQKHHHALLEYARQNGKRLKPEHFLGINLPSVPDREPERERA